MEGRLTPYCSQTGQRGDPLVLPKSKVERVSNHPSGLRGGLIVGSAPDCGLVVDEPGWEPYHLVFSWTEKHSTWRLSSMSPVPVIVDNVELEKNGEPLSFWETNLRLEGLETQLKFERHPSPPLMNGRPVVDVPLSAAGLVIGRGPRNEDGGTRPRLCLDDDIASIAPCQCEIVLRGADFIFINRNLEKPEWRTLYNGIQDYDDEVKLVLGDCIQIQGCDPYTFKFTGNALRHIGHAGVLRGEELTVEVGGGRRILHSVNLEVHRGKFLGIIGGSGQGKSTFLNAICGIVPATAGRVSVDGRPIRSPREVADVGIGYVPQDDIVHKELIVDDALYYAARLRLSASKGQIRDVIQATLDVLDLAEHRRKRIFQLSGGQRKRVSIASELLASPDYLFLDEPTSGLDPQTEKSLMGALEQLSIRRRMGVACTTHVLQNAGAMKRMAYISRGRMIFHSRPVDAARFFLNLGSSDGGTSRRSSIISANASGSEATASASASSSTQREAQYSDDYLLDKIKLIYDRAQDLKDPVEQQDRTAEEWEQKYKASPYFIAPTPGTGQSAGHAPAPKSKRIGAVKSLLLLISRQWKLLVSAKLNYLFLLMQAVLIGVLVAWVDENVVLQMFLCVIATLWFGCSNGAQQIVAELPIFRRERLAGLGVHAYLMSKFIFLTVITAVQAMILFFIVVGCNHLFHPEEDDTKDNPPPAVAAEPQGDYERNIPDDETPDHLGVLRRKAVRAFRSQFFDNQKWSILAKGDDGLTEKIPEPATEAEPVKDSDGVVGKVAADGFSGIIDFDAPTPAAGGGGPDPLEPQEVKINLSGLRVTDPEYLWLERLAWFFNLRENVIGSLAVTTKMIPAGTAEMVLSYNGKTSWKLLLANIIGLRIAALLLAAMVGVGLGLAVSSLVNTPTQAVMWVPLILIPQILFGAFVVIAPEMDDGVLAFSRMLPSFNLQRIMDVSLVHGQSAGSMTNKSKIPAFISPPPADEETVKWKDADANEVETKYDRISDVNKSWQNLTVDRNLIGKREKAVDEASGAGKDTVEARPDVRVKKGDVYKTLIDSYTSAGVLGTWVVSCYIIAAFSLFRRQTGR